ncbi:hypothetical protein BGW39_003082 [Mortierella sp. 14UC]|nr:hypothetical protein BGW39_003082 [Mortierella sp. 14UC]
MKFSTLYFIAAAALASSTQAMKLRYDATTLSTFNGETFKARMYLEGKNLWTVNVLGGESAWVPYGIHKIQLRDAMRTSFKYCIDVFGDVSCDIINTGVQDCKYEKNKTVMKCSVNWRDDNYGFKKY